MKLHCANDDQACLTALETLWAQVVTDLPTTARIIRVGTTLQNLTPGDARQLDIFLNDDATRQKWERLTQAQDNLNKKFGKRVLSIGPWTPPPGEYTGAKISYTRIPSTEDFW